MPDHVEERRLDRNIRNVAWESGRDYFLVAYGGYKKGKRFLIASLLVLKVNELPTEWH